METCSSCHKSFEIHQLEKDFDQKIGLNFGNPGLCPNCRDQLRLAWRNDTNLYSRKCDATGENLVTMFHPDAKVKVIHKDFWYSDEYDGRKYGQDFDFERPFFEQFNELMQKAPLPHTMVSNDTNSLYTNYTYANKNCYLCFAGNYLEDSLYCYNAENSSDCADCLFVSSSELCYQCIHVSNSYNLKYSLHSNNCSDSAFLENCSNCRDCFMCFNLNNKQYCFLNKQYSKEEYKKLISDISLGKKATLEKAYDHWLSERDKHFQPENHNVSVENCDGEYILNSKNCQKSYIVNQNCEDCLYLTNGFPDFKDSQHCTYSGEGSSLLYETMASGANCYRMFFVNLCFANCSDIYYSLALTNTKNCFGCVSLTNSKYCILNKQYSQDKYEALVPKIIEHMRQTGEWGKFFPAEISPFGYNETTAQDYYPLTEDEARAKGFNWRDIEPKKYSEQKYLGSYDIKEVPADVLDQILSCKTCTKNFKINQQELDFYRKLEICLPENCSDCRHKQRLKFINNHKRNHHNCAKCDKDNFVCYPKDEKRQIFCKKCYLDEIY
jgi:Zn ribbon nucleic-acid-binding protein